MRSGVADYDVITYCLHLQSYPVCVATKMCCFNTEYVLYYYPLQLQQKIKQLLKDFFKTHHSLKDFELQL